MPKTTLSGYGRKKRLNIAAMSNCELWIDVARTDTLTFPSGSNVSQVRDLSGKNRHLTKTGAGQDTTYPVHIPAERGLKFLNSAYDQMIAGAVGDWNFLHNGNGCTILLLVKVDSTMAANAVILSTSSEAASGVGTNIWYFNTNQQYNVTTRNGSSQTFYNTGATNSLTKNANTILSVHIESRTGNPPDLVGRSNGATDLKTSNLATYASGNSTGTLIVGKLPDANFKCTMIFKKCAIFSRRISKAEENRILEAWAAEEGISLTRYGSRDLAIIAGQSNATGRGLISASHFTANETVTNAQIFNSSGFSWATLQAGVNNAAYTTSHLGLEMNLAKKFTTLSGRALQIVKVTADGVPITSWDTSNSNFINLQTAIKRAKWALEDDGYVVSPFFVWYQGESDAQTTSDANAYASRLQTFLNNVTATQGFEQMPSYIVQIAQSPVYTDTATVQNAELTTAMTVPYSSYVKYVETADIAVNTDQNHIDAQSLDALGERIARRYLGLPG